MPGSAPAHEIIKIPDFGAPGRDALKQQCFDVRIAVFTHEQGFPLETEVDEADDTATHFLLRLVPSLAPIGTVRCVLPKGKDSDAYKLGRLVVLAPYRKYRLGRALVLALHEWATQHAVSAGGAGPIRLIVHSQLPVKAFYAKFGYQPEGEEFEEDGAPHQKMVLRISISANA